MIIIPRRAACIIRAAAEKRDGRVGMECVRVMEYEGQFWVEATDGRMLAIARGPAGIAPIMPPELESPPDHAYLVPAAVWKQVWDAKDEYLGFAADRDLLYVCSMAGELGLRDNGRGHPKHDGRFPDIGRAIDVEAGAMLSVRLSAEHLKRIASMALEFAKGAAGSPSVKLAFGRPNRAVSFHVTAEDGHTLEGLLMPLEDKTTAGYEPGSQRPPKEPEVPPPAKPARKRR